MQMFEVGGCVRDEILGLPSKDIDFSVVLEVNEKRRIEEIDSAFGPKMGPFGFMQTELAKRGFKVFLSTPEFLTVRAQFPSRQVSVPGSFPDSQLAVKRVKKGITADFVLARKESGYTDGRRPDEVIPGTLEDDLNRRDFTMNAIAKDTQGNFIDPHNGRRDIADGIIRAVGDPFERFNEDALRAVRALRFSVTKDFVIAPSVRFAMQSAAVLDAIVNKISDERIQQELSKMLRHNSVLSIIRLNEFPALTAAMFSGRVNLDATMKQKGFN